MKRKGYTPEQITSKLREADVLSSQGRQWRKYARNLASLMHYRWRKECDGK